MGGSSLIINRREVKRVNEEGNRRPKPKLPGYRGDTSIKFYITVLEESTFLSQVHMEQSQKQVTKKISVSYMKQKYYKQFSLIIT